MTIRGRRSRRGSSMLEFTLIAIPLIFILISVVELSRGMWVYNTLAFSVKRGTRFTSVHGKNCAAASTSCAVTVGTVAQTISDSAPGLDPQQLQVVLETTGATQNCRPLSSCLGRSDAWPPAASNDVGTSVTISGTYPFRSALAMFWPGAGAVKFGAVNFGATSREEIAF